MKILCTIFTAVVLLTAAVQAADTDADGFTALFNGKDLTGWDGKTEFWSVQNGVITSESTPANPCKKSNYLTCTAAVPDNFHFKITFRMQGEGSNSGIQFRSKQLPDYDTYGYQADVDDSGQWTGCLFHHKRGAVVKRGFEDVIGADGKVVSSKSIGDPAELIKQYKKGGWNDYEVIADGSVITLKINGKEMCKVDDRHATEAVKSGILALQMHQGKPMKVEFKNVKIKAL
ncbi:MAG: DUF1080 domain-containing protein [Planctomycetaceae bacterium]|jgi:hypothetical protein|nr:DUF1080 domain-containing protein [Planctomycetaceae bacterium]